MGDDFTNVAAVFSETVKKLVFPSKPHQKCFALKPMKENLAWESDDEPNKTNEPKGNKNVTFQNVRGSYILLHQTQVLVFLGPSSFDGNRPVHPQPLQMVLAQQVHMVLV